MADDQLTAIDEVVVVGTGFVGLPLALVLAEHGKQVAGVDIDENLVDAINDRTIHLDELRSVLQEDGIRILQFGGDDPLNPTQHE